jgi:cytoskeletal protein RodZ
MLWAKQFQTQWKRSGPKMKPSSLYVGLRVCVMALSLSLLSLAAIPALAQNTNSGAPPATTNQSGAATQQSTRQTTTSTTTQQTQPAAPPAQTTRVETRETGTSPTLYWVIGLGVLALVVIVAIVALGKRNRDV